MTKYKIIFHWGDGTSSEDDNYGSYYDTESEAEYAAQDGLGAARVGAEELEMSNPGDYPFNEAEFDDASFEIVEVDD